MERILVRSNGTAWAVYRFPDERDESCQLVSSDIARWDEVEQCVRDVADRVGGWARPQLRTAACDWFSVETTEHPPTYG